MTTTDPVAARSYGLAASVLIALGLVLAACGGSDSGDGGGSQASSEGPDPSDSAVGTGQVNAPASNGDAVFDVSALSLDPIPVGLLTAVRDDAPSASARRPDPVVDPCLTIDASTVDGIVETWDSLELNYDFAAGESDGSTCSFVDRTHRIAVIVNSASALDDDFVRSLNGLGGDVSTRPSEIDAAAVLYSEDSFGVETIFAARAERDGWAVVARNGGGTGILSIDEEEEGWAQIALAALEGAIATGPVPDASTDADTGTGAIAEAVAADACAVFTPDELSAAFGVVITEMDQSNESNVACQWQSDASDLVIRVAVEPVEETRYFGGLTDLGGGVYASPNPDATYGFGGDFVFSVLVTYFGEGYGLEDQQGGGTGQKDTRPIGQAIVRSVLERVA